MAEERARRRSWPFYLVVGLILAALPVGYFLLLDKPPPPAPPPPPPVATAPDAGEPPPARPLELKLAEVGGTVEVRRADGSWTAAEKGALLKKSDAVRTSGEGSYALLIGGEAYQVRMAPGTEVSVDELTDSISRVLLAGGVATAEVHGKGRHTFEVRAKDSDAVAKTGEGSFAISNNSGTVAVGTRSGEVELLGHGKLVIVRAGQESVVHPGQEPSAPAPIPSSLLLKVQWPAVHDRNRNRLKSRDVIVAGQTEPGVVLRVGNDVVPVDAQGNFKHKVRLSEGRHTVEVTAQSVSGLHESDRADFNVDTRVEPTKFETPKWGDK